MWKYPKLPFYESIGAIPSSYLISLSYEEQILWLCSQVQAIKEGTPNYNYELLENKPSINNIPLIGNLTPEQLGLSNDYNVLSNKPMINGVIIAGNKTGSDLGLQNQLIAGSGITITGNTISATGGGGGGASSYNQLSDKPVISTITIEGDHTQDYYNLQTRLLTNITYEEGNPLTEDRPYNLSGISLGDVVYPYTSNLQTKPYSYLQTIGENTAGKLVYIDQGERLKIKGTFTLVAIDKNNTNTGYSEATAEGEENTYYITPNQGGIVLISFTNTDQITPQVDKIQSGLSIQNEQKEQDIKNKGNENNINTFLLQNGSYETLSLTNGTIYEINDSQSIVATSQLNTASFLLDITTYPIYNKVQITGKAYDKYMIIYADSNSYVLGKEAKNLCYYGQYIDLNIPEGTKYIAFSFYDISNSPAELKVLKITDIGTSSNFYTEVNESIYLNQDGSITPALTSGYYFLKDHTLYYYDSNGNTTDDNRYYNSLLYVYSTMDTKAVDLVGVNNDPTQIYHSIEYDFTNHYWTPDVVVLNEIVQNFTGNFSEVKTSIPSSGQDNNIPTIGAVRTYVGSQSGGSSFYTEIDQDVTLNLDGSSNYTFTSGTYYYLKPSKYIRYYGSDSTLHSATRFTNSIFYYEETASTKTLSRTGVNEDISEIEKETLLWESSNNYWTENYINENNYVSNSYPSHISMTKSSIPSSGSDYSVPTISAVRNYVATNIAVYSTTEHVVGTWIDGKPIYQITLQDTVPNTTTGTFATKSIDLSSYNIEFLNIVNAVMRLTIDNNTTFSNLPYLENDGNQIKLFADFSTSQKVLNIRSSAGYRSGASLYITIQYTKTTD